MKTRLPPSSSSSPVWSPVLSRDALETKPDPASALGADPDELADCLEVFGDGAAAAAAGGVLVAAGGVPELDPALLA